MCFFVVVLLLLYIVFPDVECYEHIDASLSEPYASAMPGENITGKVWNTTQGASYYWYAREENGVSWNLIGQGINMKHQFTSVGSYELIVTIDDLTSTHRTSWQFLVYVVDVDMYFVRQPTTPPIIRHPKLLTVSVKNNSNVGDVVWSYGSQLLTDCKARLAILEWQQFSCSVLVDSFTKTLKVDLRPDNTSLTWSTEEMYPVTTFDVYPKYVQKGSTTYMTLINRDGNNVDTLWKNVKQWDGTRRDFTQWGANYKFQNTVGSDVLTVHAFNLVSEVKKNIWIEIVDVNSFQILNDFSSTTDNLQTVVSFGVTVKFFLGDKTSNTHYMWQEPSITRASLIPPTNNNSRIINIYANNTANPTPWSFELKVTPFLDRAPQFPVKTLHVHVYKPISAIRSDSDIHALIVGTVHSFNIYWDGSEGSCQTIQLTETNAGQDFISDVELTHTPHECKVTLTVPQIPGKLLLIIQIENKANQENFARTFESLKTINHLNISQYEEIALGMLYQLSVENPPPDTYFGWSLTNETSYHITVGESDVVQYTVPSTLQLGYYNLTMTASGHLLRDQHLSIQYSLKVVAAQSFPNVSPDVVFDTDPTVNTTIDLWIGYTIKHATYDWLIFNETLSPSNWSLIGYGPSNNFSIPPDLSEGTYIIKVVSKGLWVYKRVQEENVTFMICRPSTPVVVPKVNRTILVSSWFDTTVKIVTNCVTRHYWSFACAEDGQSNCHAINNQYELDLTQGFNVIQDAPSLKIPPRAFQVGSYILRDQIYIRNESVFNVSTDLTVKHSKLIAFIVGGQSKTMGSQDNIVFDASQTIDPDSATSSDTSLYYKWNLNVSCFVNQDNSVSIAQYAMANQVIRNASKDCLQIDTQYTVIVSVKRNIADAESSTYVQKIHIKEGSFLAVSIFSPTLNAYKTDRYNVKEAIKFTPTGCHLQCDYFLWTLRRVQDDVIIFQYNTSTLIIPPNTLDGQQAYMLHLTVSGLKIGESSFTMLPNPPPNNGTCQSITPTIGFAMETLFHIKCSGWKDNEEQDLIYLLIVGKQRFEYNRGIESSFDLMLPPGNSSKNWILPVEIVVMDNSGGWLTALSAQVTVQVSSAVLLNPSIYVKDNLLRVIEDAIAKKETRKAISLIIGSAFLLNLQEDVDENKKGLVNQLVVKSSAFEPSKLPDVTLILNAISLLRECVALKDVEKESRIKMLNSMKKLIIFSEIFAMEGISLSSNSQGTLVNLLSDNFEFENVISPFSNNHTVNPNYETLQNVYELVSTNLIGEEERNYRTPSVAADIRRGRGRDIFNLQASLKGCYIQYDLPPIRNLSDIVEFRECSLYNPFTYTKERSSIVSISFRNGSLDPIKIRNLAEDELVVMEIPTSLQNSIQMEYHILSYEMITRDLKEALSVSYSGGENTALHIIVEIIEGGGEGTFHIHLSNSTKPTQGNLSTAVRVISMETPELERSFFIPGSEFDSSEALYFGLEHDYFTGYARVSINFYISTCQYWNVTLKAWQGAGCRPLNSTRTHVTCACNHLTSFGSGLTIVPRKPDFTILKSIDIEENPVAMVTIMVVIFLYIICMFIAHHKDREEEDTDNLITFIGSEESFYHYEIRIKTGVYPFAGTTSKVGIQIFGTSCVTKTRVLKTPQSFQRNSLDIFRISLDQSIGKVHKIEVWHDNSGSNPSSWYVERIVIKSMVDGEKFFFFCNSWIDAEQGNLVHQFHVADKEELQKFSTIFFDTLGRCLNDFHMWLSLFERPKYSKFSRQQRLTCLFTFLFSWMAVNAMWFNGGDHSFTSVSSLVVKGFSLEEIVIGFITVAMVFPLNFIFFLLFRKSRQREFPYQLLKIWKKPKRVHMEFVDISDTLLHDDDDDDDDDDEHDDDDHIEEAVDVISRRKNCRNIHELLAEDEELTKERTTSLLSASTASTYKLLLPHSFGHEELNHDHQQFLQFERWKNLHFRNANLPQSHLPAEDHHALSCTALREKSPKMRRAHSADSIRQDDSFDVTLPAGDWEGGGTPTERKREFTNITERVHSGHYSTAGRDEFTRFEYNDKHALQIRKNEQLSKQLQIPDIIEYDASINWTLPHWCVYVGYTCCFLLSSFCAIVVLTYGQQFGYPVALKWLKSLLFGFVEDIFFIYPLLMIVTAFVTALFVKPRDLDQIDHIDFRICASSPGQINNTETFPPTDDVLESMKKSGAQKKKRLNRMRDVLLQVLLSWLVMGIAVNNTITIQIQNQTYRQHERNAALNYLNNDKGIDLHGYWSWFETTFIPLIYTPSMKIDGWKMTVPPLIQQIRFVPTKCTNTEYTVKAGIQSCRWTLSPLSYVQNTEDFSTPQIKLIKGSEKYSWILDDLNSTTSTLAKVKASTWISDKTYMLSHSLLLYNSDIEVKAFLEHTIHILGGGYQMQQYKAFYFLLDKEMTAKDTFTIIAIFIILVFGIWLIVRKALRNRKRFEYMSKFWCIHLVCWLVVAMVTLVKFPLCINELHNFNKNEGNEKENLVPIHSKYNQVRNLLATLIFLIQIRWLRVIRWTSIYRISQRVVLKSLGPLLRVMVFHISITFIFSHSTFLLCHLKDHNYRTFKDTFTTLLLFPWVKTTQQNMDTNIPTKTIQFLYLLYTCLFSLHIFKPLVLKITLSGCIQKHKPEEKYLGGETKWFSNFVKKIKNRIHPKKNKHVHFDTVNDYQSRKSSVDSLISPLLPPLPFSNERLDEHLFSAIHDLDNMLAIDEWEQEFYNHFERRFRHSGSF